MMSSVMSLIPSGMSITKKFSVFHLVVASSSIRAFEIGERIINLERAYLVREGIRRKDDYLLARFLKESLANGNSKGAIFKIEHMLDEYYAEREWNPKTRVRSGKLRKIGLEYVIEYLKRNEVETK